MIESICIVLLGLGASLGLNAVYVNNHKIDKYEVDKIKLVSPAPSSDHVTKIDLITKDNFTNPLHYYQYLVGNDPGGHVELLWGNNKTYLPTIFRSTTTTEPSVTTNSINYADDLSSVENTLNNTTPIYKGDYHVEPIQSPSTTTARPIRRLKKPTKKPPVIKNHTEISEKTLELLRKYFTINCTLTPLQEPSTTPMPKIATSTKKPKAKIKRRKNIKTTAASTSASTTATTTARPWTKKIKPTKQRQPFEQVVYVDPPVISTISGVLENIYNYMEDAFVSTEYISIEDDQVQDQRKHLALQAKKAKNSKKIKRNSVEGQKPEMTTDSSAFTSKQYQEETPKHVTLAEVPLIEASQSNKNKLTTNIHVTSEYSPATPATVSFVPQAVIDDKDESSEESDEGDYYEGFSNTSYEEDDDDDEDDDGSQEDEENSEEYDESVEAAGNQAGGVVNDKDYDYEDSSAGGSDKTKVKITHQPSGGEDYSEEESEEYDSGEDTSSGPGSFFTGLFSSIGRFVRSLGFGPRTTVEYDDYDETRSTTPRIVELKKRPTRSTPNLDTQTQIERIHDATEKQQAWYHYPPYLYNEIEEPEIHPPAVDTDAVPEQNADHDWFNFMTPWDFFNPWIPWDNSLTTESSADSIEITLAPTATTTTESSAGWLPSLFGGESSTGSHSAKPTTQKPLIPFLPASDPLQKPENWFGVIAQHVFTTTRKPKTTTQIPSTTHLTKPTKVLYSGYQLWRVYPRTTEHMRSLEDYRLSPEGVKLQWWKGPSLRGANDILVPPHMVETFGEYLQDEDITNEIVIRNLAQAIQYENPKMTRREQIEIEVLHGHPLTWYRYHRYADLTKFMNYLGRRFAKNVELIHIGRSFEGRPLTVVKVRFDGKRSLGDKMSNSKYMKGKKSKRKTVVKRRGQRPAVFIEAGAHGREWLGPSVATWILDSLTKAISSNDTELESIKAMDWYVLPVFNPDGYEYSHEYDRMWRKSRSKHQETQSSGILSTALNWLQSQSSLSVDSDQGCIGTDLNRNWDHRWNQEGASKSACSEYYSGYKAFSELETRALSKFLMQAGRNIQIYLSLHSYGQTISYPDRKRSAGSERYGDLHEMAAVAVEALRGSGSHVSYQVDSEGELSYPSSGTSVEFARYEAGIKYTYSVDLPDTGTHGFLFPPSGIESTAKDTFELIKGMVDYI